MKRTIAFYHWFKNLGGNVQSAQFDTLNSQLNEPSFLVSTLKARAEEIKEKYNYKFC